MLAGAPTVNKAHPLPWGENLETLPQAGLPVSAARVPRRLNPDETTRAPEGASGRARCSCQALWRTQDAPITERKLPPSHGRVEVLLAFGAPANLIKGDTVTDPQFQPPASYQQPPVGAQPVTVPQPAPARGGKSRRTSVIAGVAGLAVGVVLGAAMPGSGDGGEAAVPAAAPTVTVTASAAPAPTVTVTATAEPVVTEAEPEPTAEETKAATDKPANAKYKKLTARKFKKLAKNPDSYTGDLFIIYGEVTQFDSATGTEVFRADTGPKKLKPKYGYVDFDQNTMLTGTEDQLKDVVTGDLFKAKVMVVGSYSYDTQIGGSTTVPMFLVSDIEVYDSLD